MSYPPAESPAGYGTPANDLSQPLRGATISQASRRFFQKYATFTGRASRSEFWWWSLVAVVVGLILELLDALTSGGFAEGDRTLGSLGDLLSYLWGLATLIPGLALGARRLHDIDKSGWWQLLLFLPVIGAIILIVWWATAPRPAGITRDPGYQAAGYGGYPQFGAYDPGAYGGAPAGGQYGPPGGQYGPDAYGAGPYGPPANDPYSDQNPGQYGSGPANDPYPGQNPGQYGPGPTNDPYGPGPRNDSPGSGPSQH